MYTIYLIQNLANDKVYVGQSINPKSRFSTHKWALNKGTHHCEYLQKAWQKYTGKQFTFQEIFTVDTQDEADKFEQFFINWYKELDLCYNPTWNHKGRGEVSQETRQKLRDICFEDGRRPPSRKGYKFTEADHERHRLSMAKSEETRKKKQEEKKANLEILPCPICSNPRTHKFSRYQSTCGSVECVRESRKRNTNYTPTPETIEKMRQSRLGSKHSTEHREKQSQAMKGKTPSNFEHIRKLVCKDFCVINPEGIEIRSSNIAEFCDQNNLERHRFGMLLNGKIDEYKGWTRNE